MIASTDCVALMRELLNVVQEHAEAVHAIVGMNGQTVGGKPLKCSWGRHQSSRAQGALLLCSIQGWTGL